MRTDSLTRDDMSPSETPVFDAITDPALREALLKLAKKPTHNSVELPANMANTRGWLMVPSKHGRRMISYSGRRAWTM